MVAMLLPQAPTIVTQPAGVGVPFGSRATISCTVGGFPFPTVQWSRDGAQQTGPVAAAGPQNVVGGARSSGVGCEALWTGSRFVRDGEGHWKHNFAFLIHAVVDESLCGSYSAVATYGMDSAQSDACEISLLEGSADAFETKASRVVDLTEVIAELAEMAMQCDWTPVLDTVDHDATEPCAWQRRSADGEQESTTVHPQNHQDLKRRLDQEFERIGQLNSLAADEGEGEGKQHGKKAQIVHFECRSKTAKAGVIAAQHLANVGDVHNLAGLIQILTVTVLRTRLASAFVRSLRTEVLTMLDAAAQLYAPRADSEHLPWWPHACHHTLAVAVSHMLRTLARALSRALGKLDFEWVGGEMDMTGTSIGFAVADGAGVHAHLIELLLMYSSREAPANLGALTVELSVGEEVLKGLSSLAIAESEITRGDMTTTVGRGNIRMLLRNGVIPALCSRMHRSAALFEQLQEAQTDNSILLGRSCRLLEQGCILLSNAMFESQAITAGISASGLPIALVRVVSVCSATFPSEKWAETRAIRSLRAALARTFEMACHALGNVTVVHVPQQLLLTPPQSEAGKARLRCLQALVHAMQCHRDDAEAMKAAVEVIGNFACAGDDDNVDEEPDPDEVADKEALSAVPKGSTSLLDSAHALEGEELSRFAMQHVIDDGAVAAVVLSARTHKSSPTLLLSALDALCNMADDRDALSTMVQEGATACVMDVLATSVPGVELDPESDEFELLHRAMQLLAVLTECRAAVPLLTTTAGVRSLFTMMAAHSGMGTSVTFHDDTMELLLCAAVALENAAFDPQGVQELQQAVTAVTIRQGTGNDCVELDGLHVLLELLATAARCAKTQVGTKDLTTSLLHSISNLCAAPQLAASITGATESGELDSNSELLTVIAMMKTWSEDNEVLVLVFGLFAQVWLALHLTSTMLLLSSP